MSQDIAAAPGDHKTKYPERLTDLEVIALFDPVTGLYYIGDNWQIYRREGRNGSKPNTLVKPFNASDRSTTPWVRLYNKPKWRTIAVSRIVWMVSTGQPIPPGFEIHHKDTDDRNNARRNLICLHSSDHHFVHDELEGRTGDEPNDIPF